MSEKLSEKGETNGPADFALWVEMSKATHVSGPVSVRVEYSRFRSGREQAGVSDKPRLNRGYVS